METTPDSIRLRIYIGEAARHGHQPLHEAIVLKAREMNLAGATVFRGAMGYGKSSLLHTTKILRLSDDLPVVIEIVESEARINAFLAVLGPMMPGGMATLDPVKAIHFQGSSATG
jgi:uncharacterized protein